MIVIKFLIITIVFKTFIKGEAHIEYCIQSLENP